LIGIQDAVNWMLCPARRIVRALFLSALAGVLVLALAPPTVDTLPDFGWDKLYQAFAFFVLGLLGARGYPDQNWRLARLLIGYGFLIEALQGLTPYRAFAWGDLSQIPSGP